MSIMNSNGDYTICNLDNHTYSANMPHEALGNGAYSYAAVNNGLSDTAQLAGYGSNGAGTVGAHAVGPLDCSVGPPQQQGGLQYHPGPGGGGSVITHSSQPPGPYGMPHPNACAPVAQTQAYYPHHHHHPHHHHYGSGGMIPGDGTGHHQQGDEVSQYGYHNASPGNYCNPGYPLPTSPMPATPGGAPEGGGNIATFKWMTVKRSVSKNGKK